MTDLEVRAMLDQHLRQFEKLKDALESMAKSIESLHRRIAALESRPYPPLGNMRFK